MSSLKDPQQELFLHELLSGKSQADAYVAAGYKAKNANVAAACASKLLRNANVAERYAELKEALIERTVEKSAVSKVWVIQRLVENVDRAMQAEPVRRKAASGDDEEVAGEYVYNGNVANRALELIGKELGMFIDRKEVGDPGEFDRMSTEELRAFVYGDKAEKQTTKH